jgi:hypothetical protein
LEKNVVYVAKIGGEISDIVCPVYFYHHPRPPTVYFQEKSIEDCALILGIPAISKDCRRTSEDDRVAREFGRKFRSNAIPTAL